MASRYSGNPTSNDQNDEINLGNLLKEIDFSITDNFKLVIQKIMNRKTIDPKALVLYTKDGNDLNLETAFSLEVLCDKNIPLIDYYVIQKNFKVSSAQTKITVSINTYEGNYNATDYTNSLYIAYYLFMTRNKLSVDNDEPRPRFLLSGLNMDDFSNDYLNYLTKNDIVKEHLILFFKDIDPQLIDLKVRSRLAKGIAVVLLNELVG